MTGNEKKNVTQGVGGVRKVPKKCHLLSDIGKYRKKVTKYNYNYLM
jgi:hypothetical protein